MFVAIQRRKKDPLIPLKIFKTRNLLGSNIVMALLGAAWIPMWFFLNLYLQQIIGYGPWTIRKRSCFATYDCNYYGIDDMVYATSDKELWI
jgi:hypothetical protein